MAQWLERATDNRVVAGSNPTEAVWKLWQFPLPHFASVYSYVYSYVYIIRICFIALCNICSLMSENSSVELMFIFITRR